MNVVVVDNTFFSDVRVCKQVRFLASQSLAVHVFCLRFKRSEAKVTQWNGATVTAFYIPRMVKNLLYLLMNRLDWYERLWVFLLKITITQCPKNIHVHDLYMAKIGYKEKQRWQGKPKLFLDLHENYPVAIQSYSWANHGIRKVFVNPQRWFHKESRYLNFADVVITLSDTYARELQQRYPELKGKTWLTMPNYIDTQWFDLQEVQPIEYETNRRVLFYFGAIAKRRGIFNLLHALIDLGELASAFHVVLIGPVDKADESAFYQLTKSHELHCNVTYIPWIKLSQLPSYIANADISLAPFIPNDQHNSGVANKIYQYMYFAKFILASNCKPQEALIRRAENGLVYTDQKSLLMQLERLTAMAPGELKEFGEKGRAYLMQNCSGLKENQALLSLYQ